jgi:hypothetical protein
MRHEDGMSKTEIEYKKEMTCLLPLTINVNYVQRGLIPYVRIQSNLRFVKPDVLAWVAEHSSEVQN